MLSAVNEPETLVPLRSLSESAASAAFRGKPHAFIDVGHSRLAYWRLGRGPDVVFVHGWPLHSATFRHIALPLSRQFTCHFFDLPGTGQTEWGPASPIDLGSHASTLRRVIGELGLERYAMVAHDSGAVVARLAAADDPRVAGLVIGNSEIPGYRPWLVELYAATAKLPGGVAVLGQLMRLSFIRRSFLGYKGCFANIDYLDGEFHELFVQPILHSKQTAFGQMGLLKNLDWRVVDGLGDAHRRIRAPVRLVWGALDPFFPVARARKMLPGFPGGAELVEIPGAKLFAHEDHPEAFVAASVPFLTSCLA